MTDCGCDKAKKDLEEYLHNELLADEAADIREHLATCANCAGEAEIGIVLIDAVQRACRETAPEQLRVQVLARIRELQLH
ncbi:MAG TPA: zf-HC2 domain-containing protein [Gryllotalpicola sp.]